MITLIRSAVLWLWNSRAGRIVAAVGAAALAFWLALKRAENRGEDRANRKAKEADHENADEIRERADEARRRLDGADDDWVRDSPANRDRN